MVLWCIVKCMCFKGVSCLWHETSVKTHLIGCIHCHWPPYIVYTPCCCQHIPLVDTQADVSGFLWNECVTITRTFLTSFLLTVDYIIYMCILYSGYLPVSLPNCVYKEVRENQVESDIATLILSVEHVCTDPQTSIFSEPCIQSFGSCVVRTAWLNNTIMTKTCCMWSPDRALSSNIYFLV